ncbi:unnamed protein product, partial [Owenia fusiformis]
IGHVCQGVCVSLSHFRIFTLFFYILGSVSSSRTMGGGEKFQIPDWRMYKAKDLPMLTDLERALAARGLKDPWIRNYAWRYMPGNYTPPFTLFKMTVFRGFKWGLALTAVAIVLDGLRTKYNPPKHGHH